MGFLVGAVDVFFVGGLVGALVGSSEQAEFGLAEHAIFIC